MTDTPSLPDIIDDDIISDLECALLGPEAPANKVKAAKKQAQQDIEKAQEMIEEESKNPLVAIFLGKEIRVVGTVKDPLFCAADVGKYIGDINPSHTLKKYPMAATAETGAYVHLLASKDTKGREQKMLYLTENGLYRYLLRSDKEKAIEFQAYVYRIVRVERDKVVDARELAEKIARTLCEEQLRETTADLRMTRHDMNRAMVAANDAREKVRKLEAQIAKTKKKEENAWSKEHTRLLALEEENRTRGPFQSAHRF